MQETPGFSVRIYIPYGNPEGLRLLEKSNWTGQGLIFPRSIFPDIRGREELARTGIYILWGLDDDTQLSRVYVGRSSRLERRLDYHNKDEKKDFWTHSVAFVSKDENFNVAHAQYLEAKLVSLLKEANRCVQDNKDTPQEPPLSDADRDDARLYLTDMLLCLPIAGVNFFEKLSIPDENSSITKLYLNANGIRGEGYQDDSGVFVVLADSRAAKNEVASVRPNIVRLRQELKAQGVLVEDGDSYQFIRNYIFNSPSAAAGVLTGASYNGRDIWKDPNGRSIKEIEETTIDTE